MARAIRIGPDDDVATLLEDARAGDRVAGVQLLDDVGRGHKVALRDLAAGAAVAKFGYPIGRTAAAVRAGEHVHSHNLRTALTGERGYRYDPAPAPLLAAAAAGSFRGYLRADGRAATRNELWVIPTVGCVARTAERIAREAGPRVAGTVDGVHAFAHPFGCSQLGDDLRATRRLLASLACHPNAGGVLVLGLGCEENGADALLAEVPEWRRPAVRVLRSQMAGDEVKEGAALLEELARGAAAERRELGLDRLVLGVKCGGSDGLSGLTANPLVGQVADRVAGAGGRVLLTEIPEMFGAEQVLLDRCADRHVFDRLAGTVNGFKRYYLDHGEPVSENPSPGNVEGGITTLEEKSLGAVQKGGRAPVADVLDYGERVRADGLSVVEAPGNDAVSCTALTAAGATVILFTTGRGTPLGFPVPTLKIASNAELAAAKPRWIDFDASAALDIGASAAADALTERLLAVAGGDPCRAEQNGEREVAIWKRGVTL